MLQRKMPSTTPRRILPTPLQRHRNYSFNVTYVSRIADSGLLNQLRNSVSEYVKYRPTMRKLFICLANSRKYSGRCIAGVELYHGADGRLRMVETEQHHPQWIRPISQSEFGALNASDVRHIKLGDSHSY